MFPKEATTNFLNRIVETENIMFSCHSHHFENDVLVTTRLNEAPN